MSQLLVWWWRRNKIQISPDNSNYSPRLTAIVPYPYKISSRSDENCASRRRFVTRRQNTPSSTKATSLKTLPPRSTQTVRLHPNGPHPTDLARPLLTAVGAARGELDTTFGASPRRRISPDRTVRAPASSTTPSTANRSRLTVTEAIRRHNAALLFLQRMAA